MAASRKWQAAVFWVAVALAVIFPVDEARAGTQVASSTYVGNITGDLALGYRGPRKLVRDADGYWYAVWTGYVGGQYRVYMNKSSNTTGTSWNTPVMLCGSGGIVLNTASACYYPAIDIDRANGRTHLVFQVADDYLYYAKLIDFSNWNSSTYWKNLQETSTGSEILSTNTDDFSISQPNSYQPTIALDSGGNPHVAWCEEETGGSGTYRPYYATGSISGGWNSKVELSSTTKSLPTVEVDSNDRAHVFCFSASTGSEYYADSPYTSFSGPGTVISSFYINSTLGLSVAADDNGKIHLAAHDSTGSDIWTAYYDGSSWTTTQDMDAASWWKPDVGVKLGTGGIDHVVIAADTTDGSVYSWKWSGSAWGQPETDSGDNADIYISLEKKSPARTRDQGVLYFDDNGSTDAVYFGRVTGPGPKGPLVAYTEESTTYDDIIRYQTYSSSWSSEGSAYDTNNAGALQYHQAATSADGKKQAVVAVGTSGTTLYGAVFDGSSWTTKSFGTITNSDRRDFALAFEQQSGQLLVVASSGALKQIKYWVWDGSSWVVDGATHTFTTVDDYIRVVKLGACPGTNQIALSVLDQDGDVVGLIWDGESNSWGNEKKLNTGSPNYVTAEPIAVEYMQSGKNAKRALFVWAELDHIRSWTWNGGYWAAASNFVDSPANSNIINLRLAADPNSDKMLLAFSEYNQSLSTLDWNGSAWGTARSISSAAVGDGWNISFDVAFESASGHSGHALIVYSDDSGTPYAYYRHTSDIGGAWGSQTSIETATYHWRQLAGDLDGTVHLLASDASTPNKLVSYTWDKSSWSVVSERETDLRYDAGFYAESFALTTTAPSPSTSAASVTDPSAPLLGISTASSSTMQYSTWDGSDLANAASGPVFNSAVDWIVVESAPAGKMMLGVTWGDGTSGVLYASFFDGTSWGTVKSLGSAHRAWRGFDAAVETQSGQILIVASSATSLKYWVYDQGTWVVDGATITGLTLGSGTKQFLELASNPTSNEIALVFTDNASDSYGVIWNGETNTWGNEQTLETTLSTSSYQPAGVAYMQTGTGAGKAMFVWCASTNMESRIWNGSSWESQIAAERIGGGGYWVRLKPDPNSDRLAFGVVDGVGDLNIYTWDGSAWSNSAVELETTMLATNGAYPSFDLIFERGAAHTSDITVVYSDTTNLRYVHADWNGSSYYWGSETDVNAAYDAYFVQLE